MEYAIAGCVTALFIVIFLLTRPKEREEFSSVCDEEEFRHMAKSLAESLPAPSDGGQEVRPAPYKRKIKRALRRINESRDDAELKRIFLILADRKEDLKKLIKTDFSALESLPAVSGTARSVLIAEATLSHSRYIFCEDRAAMMFEAFNAARTLTFAEIDAMESAFRFVLYKKLAFLCERLTVIDDMRATALRVAKHPRLCSSSNEAKRLRSSVVFSRFCAGELGYDTEKFDEKYLFLTDELATCLNNVFDSLDNISIFDFSAFYEPCGILARYDTFASAAPECRAAFLNKLGELSNAENLDEYAYTLRLENYGERGKLPPFKVRRLPIGKGNAVVARFDGDLLMLARALSSPTLMQMLFGQSGGKSIIKNTKIKSSYMPKTRTFSANFGISAEGDSLRVTPDFPEEIVSAECVLRHKGVRHKVRIERGEPSLTVNGTLMKGVPAVKLGEIPLEIVVTLPDKPREP